jgi:O-antigen/teichoic acid export membrane protein
VDVYNSNKNNIQRPLSLKHNFSWTLFGNVVYVGSQWLILTSIAKLGNAQMVGQFSLGLAITAPIFMLTNMQIRSVQATSTTTDYVFGHYLGLRILTSVIALFSVLVTILFGTNTTETNWVIIIIAIAKVFESLSDVGYGLFQKEERLDKISISLIIKGPLSFFIMSLLLWITQSIILSVSGLALSWLFVYIFYDLKEARFLESVQPLFKLNVLWSLTKICFPLGIVLMLISLNTNIPRYFIQSYLEIEKIGYFSAITYIMIAGTTVIGALGQSATPRLAKYYSLGHLNDYKKLVLKLIFIGLFIGLATLVIVVVFGKEILVFLYDKDYASFYDVFVLVTFSACISNVASFMGYAITAARIFKVQPYINLLITLINTIICMFLIKSHGLEGAAFTLIITSSIQLVGNFLVYFYYLRKRRKEIILKACPTF